MRTAASRRSFAPVRRHRHYEDVEDHRGGDAEAVIEVELFDGGGLFEAGLTERFARRGSPPLSPSIRCSRVLGPRSPRGSALPTGWVRRTLQARPSRDVRVTARGTVDRETAERWHRDGVQRQLANQAIRLHAPQLGGIHEQNPAIHSAQPGLRRGRSSPRRTRRPSSPTRSSAAAERSPTARARPDIGAACHDARRRVPAPASTDEAQRRRYGHHPRQQ
jgi:hypothetical protein